jgi:arylsulfate sulfotransferase
MRMVRLAVVNLFLLSVFAAGSLAATKSPASVTITLNPGISSPQFLGTSILWTASVHNGQQGHAYDYRFAVSFQNQVQIVRDFNTPNTFTWVPYTVEGTYQVTVTVRDITQVPYIVYAPVSAPYVLLPWVTQSGGSAVHATSHPLVALFSGPPCQTGHTLLVRFSQAGSNVSSTTNSVACSPNSANFYVAGMLPTTQYLMHWEEYGPNLINQGPDLSFVTGPLPADFPKPTFTVNVPPTEHDATYPVLLFSFINSGFWPTATDLSGNVIWYLRGTPFLTRMEPGGNIFAFPDFLTLGEYDLAGNEILETNMVILNEQLAAKGFPSMDDFNVHETRRLPNGNIILLGAIDLVSTKYQGGTQQNPVDILGDLILVLDSNLQLVWAWNPFDHEDLSRLATLDDTCMNDNQNGCPLFNSNFSIANDWLHTNAAQYTSDGNIIVSQRNQDFVIKVNYQNGQGDGSIIWRLGPYGDFTLLNPPKQSCGDPNVFPWFTHQHDAAFQAQGGGQLGLSLFTVFDDGNLRVTQCNGGNSRGIVMLISEADRTVNLETEADLGQYSFALGSADLLPASDGLYASYGNGFINPGAPFAQSSEVNLGGKIVYQLQANSASYRTYRKQNLYTPTLP